MPRNFVVITSSALAVAAIAGGAIAIRTTVATPHQSVAGTSQTDKPESPAASQPSEFLIDPIAAGDEFFKHARERQAAWLAAFIESGKDVATLPRLQLSDSFIPPADENLDAAAKAADLVVEGTVSDLTFKVDYTIASVKVADVFGQSDAASSDGVVRVAVSGGPVEGMDGWDSAVLDYAPAIPYLFVGQHVFLLLKKTGMSEVPYMVVPFTGEYQESNGGITTSAVNPFRDTIVGLSVDEFRSRIEAAIR